MLINRFNILLSEKQQQSLTMRLLMLYALFCGNIQVEGKGVEQIKHSKHEFDLQYENNNPKVEAGWTKGKITFVSIGTLTTVGGITYWNGKLSPTKKEEQNPNPVGTTPVNPPEAPKNPIKKKEEIDFEKQKRKILAEMEKEEKKQRDFSEKAREILNENTKKSKFDNEVNEEYNRFQETLNLLDVKRNNRTPTPSGSDAKTIESKLVRSLQKVALCLTEFSSMENLYIFLNKKKMEEITNAFEVKDKKTFDQMCIEQIDNIFNHKHRELYTNLLHLVNLSITFINDKSDSYIILQENSEAATWNCSLVVNDKNTRAVYLNRLQLLPNEAITFDKLPRFAFISQSLHIDDTVKQKHNHLLESFNALRGKWNNWSALTTEEQEQLAALMQDIDTFANIAHIAIKPHSEGVLSIFNFPSRIDEIFLPVTKDSQKPKTSLPETTVSYKSTLKTYYTEAAEEAGQKWREEVKDYYKDCYISSIKYQNKSIERNKANLEKIIELSHKPGVMEKIEIKENKEKRYKCIEYTVSSKDNKEDKEVYKIQIIVTGDIRDLAEITDDFNKALNKTQEVPQILNKYIKLPKAKNQYRTTSSSISSIQFYENNAIAPFGAEAKLIIENNEKSILDLLLDNFVETEQMLEKQQQLCSTALYDQLLEGKKKLEMVQLQLDYVRAQYARDLSKFFDTNIEEYSSATMWKNAISRYSQAVDEQQELINGHIDLIDDMLKILCELKPSLRIDDDFYAGYSEILSLECSIIKSICVIQSVELSAFSFILDEDQFDKEKWNELAEKMSTLATQNRNTEFITDKTLLKKLTYYSQRLNGEVTEREKTMFNLSNYIIEHFNELIEFTDKKYKDADLLLATENKMTFNIINMLSNPVILLDYLKLHKDSLAVEEMNLLISSLMFLHDFVLCSRGNVANLHNEMLNTIILRREQEAEADRRLEIEYHKKLRRETKKDKLSELTRQINAQFGIIKESIDIDPNFIVQELESKLECLKRIEGFKLEIQQKYGNEMKTGTFNRAMLDKVLEIDEKAQITNKEIGFLQTKLDLYHYKMKYQEASQSRSEVLKQEIEGLEQEIHNSRYPKCFEDSITPLIISLKSELYKSNKMLAMITHTLNRLYEDDAFHISSRTEKREQDTVWALLHIIYDQVNILNPEEQDISAAIKQLQSIISFLKPYSDKLLSSWYKNGHTYNNSTWYTDIVYRINGQLGVATKENRPLLQNLEQSFIELLTEGQLDENKYIYDKNLTTMEYLESFKEISVKPDFRKYMIETTFNSIATINNKLSKQNVEWCPPMVIRLKNLTKFSPYGSAFGIDNYRYLNLLSCAKDIFLPYKEKLIINALLNSQHLEEITALDINQYIRGIVEKSLKTQEEQIQQNENETLLSYMLINTML